MPTVNLGNVVGLLKSLTAPSKKYVVWAKILNISFPDIVELYYWDDVGGAWTLLTDSTTNYWLRPVISATVTTPPGAPAEGDRYVIPVGATGVWSGNVQKVAHYKSGAWQYVEPLDGYMVIIRDQDSVIFDYRGVFGAGGNWFVNDFTLPVAPGTYIPVTEKGTAFGVPELGSDSKLLFSQFDSVNAPYTPAVPANWGGTNKVWAGLDYLRALIAGGVTDSDDWKRGGNTVGSVSTMGTIDAYDVGFKANNVEVFRMTSTGGNIGVGLVTGINARVHVKAALNTTALKAQTSTDVVTFEVGQSGGNTIGILATDSVTIGKAAASNTIVGSTLFADVAAFSLTDKLPTFNKGGGAASATGAGFEIEENSSITAYFKTTSDRNGYELKAPNVSFFSTFSAATLSANRTYTLPNNTGTLALTSDISGAFWSVATGGTLTGNNTITGTGFNLQVVHTGLGSTITPGYGLWLMNSTAAAAGVQQVSGSIALEGQGWKTNATAGSQSVRYHIYTQPVQGAANPTGNLTFYSTINGVSKSEATIGATGTAAVDYNAWIGGLTINTSSTTSRTTLTPPRELVLEVNPSGGSAYAVNIALTTSTVQQGGLLTFTGAWSNTSTATLTAINLIHTLSQSGGGTGTLIGINYDPGLTAIGGTHLAGRFTSGSFLIGHTTIGAATTRMHVRGIGTGAGYLFYGEDSAGTLKFTVTDAGNVVIVGTTHLQGAIRLTSASTLNYVWTATDVNGNGSWQAATGGGGNVTKVATPVNDQIGVWTGDGTIEGTTNFTYDNTTLTVNGGTILGSAVTQNIFNTNATTVNLAGAATTLNIGNATAATVTLRPGTLVGAATTQNVYDTVATTVNAFGAATTLAIGNATAATITLRPGTLVGAATTQNVYDTVATTLNAFGVATTLTIGATTGTMNLRNATIVLTAVPATDAGFSTSTLLVRDSAGNLDKLVASGGGTTNFLRADGTWAVPASSGNVTKVATPVDNQVAVWTGDGTIEGTANFTYDNTTLTVAGGTWVGIATQNLLDTVSTTINFGAAATTLNIGGVTGSSTYNIAAGVTANTFTKDINLGTGGAVGSTTNVNIGSGNGGVTTVNSSNLAGSSATQTLFNTIATTLIMFGAVTTFTMGGTPTGALSINLFNNATLTGTTKAITLGGSGASGSTTNIDLGSAVAGAAGTLTVHMGTVTTTQTTANIWNSIATTVNFAGAATTLTLGAATGTIAIGNTTLTLTNATILNMNGVSPSLVSSSTGTLTLFNTNLVTVNAFQAATAITMGATTGILTTRNPTIVGTQTTQVLWDTVATTVNFAGAATTLTIGNATAATVTLRPGTVVGSSSTQNLYNTVATTVNVFGAATTTILGAITGTLTLRNPTVVGTEINIALWNTVTTTFNFAGAATNFTLGGTPTGTVDLSIFTNATANTFTKSLFIGTGGVSGSTTNITIGSSVAGAVGTLTLHSVTINFNETPATDAGFSTSQVLVRDNAGNVDVIAASGGGTSNFLRADGTWAAPAGGAGDMLLGTAQTVTAAKTFLDQTLLLRNPGNTFSYTLVHGAIAAARTITLPVLTGNDSFVFEAHSQTLTNKTIAAASNTITGIVDVNIGTHTSTKITITSKGLLNTSIVYTDQANSFGDFAQTFKDNQLFINNPADTFSYQFIAAAVAANRTITLPLLTGNDTMVTEAFIQTLTNKTIAAGSNTITGIADANIATHTSTKITITSKSLLNSAIVYTDQANVMGAFDTSFLTSRLRIANPANTFHYTFSTSAIITANKDINLPLLTGNDVMVLEAHTQTLANKTLTSPIINTQVTTGSASVTLWNATATTVNFAGAATTFNIGGATGTLAIGNTTVTLTNATIFNINGAAPTLASTATGVLTLFNTNITGVNAFQASTSVTVGGTTGSWVIRNPNVLGTETAVNLWNTTTTTINFAGASTTFAVGGTPTGSLTANFFVNATDNTFTKTINIGTGGVAGSTTNITVGSTIAGTLTLNPVTIALASTPATEGSFSTATLLARASGGNLTKLVASGGGTTNFLRADGTWAAPAGGGDMVLASAQNVTGEKTFDNTTLALFNPAKTFKYSVVTSAIAAARNITLPVLTGADTFVFEAHGQTLTNKTIAAASNTITGIVDVNIGTHTSTKITITSKGLLNGQIVYTDQANTFGDFAQTFRDDRLLINNPADTFSYQFIAAAIAANRTITLPALNINDTMVTEAFAQTLTNKTIVAGSNTITGIVDANTGTFTTTKISTTSKSLLNSAIVYNDQANTYASFAQAFLTATVRFRNPANTFSYQVDTSAIITADKSILLPLLTTNDTFVFEAHTQTLTNKTLTSPIINTQVTTGSASVDLWNATATTVNFAGAATTLTIGATTGTMNLRNATIVLTQIPATDAGFSTSTLLVRDSSGNLDKLVASGGGTTNFLRADGTWAVPVGSGDMVLASAQNVTAEKTFDTTTLAFFNPAKTFKYSVVTSAIGAARNLTLPLLTGNDTMVTEAHTQTLTNKTISAASNTITGLVAHTGTPANDYVAVWTNGTTIEGGSNLTWDGATFTVGAGSAGRIALAAATGNTAQVSFTSGSAEYILTCEDDVISGSLRVTNGGNTWFTIGSGIVGIGMLTVYPSYNLDVHSYSGGASTINVQTSGTSQVGYRWQRTGGTTGTWEFRMAASTTNLTLYDGVTEEFTFTNAGVGTATNWAAASDRRLKKNITNFTGGLALTLKIAKLVRNYEWKSNSAPDIGFIAQELYEIAPLFVNPGQASGTIWSINYDKMIVPVYDAIETINDKIKRLERRIKQLEQKLAA